VVVSLDNDIFEFFAEKLFDGGFVLLCDLGEIGENTTARKFFPPPRSFAARVSVWLRPYRNGRSGFV